MPSEKRRWKPAVAAPDIRAFLERPKLQEAEGTPSCSAAAWPSRTRSGSAFTTCPVCFKTIALYSATEHIDSCLASQPDGERRHRTHSQQGPNQKGRPDEPEQPLPPGDENPRPVQDAFDLLRAAASKRKRSRVSSNDSAQGNALPPGLLVCPHEQLQGQYLVKNFVTESEERDLIQWLDTEVPNSWHLGHFNGPAYRKCWGPRIDLMKRRVDSELHPMPPILLKLCLRMRKLDKVPPLHRFMPDEANAIDYRREQGHYLRHHFDDRHLNGDILVNLCLAGDCVMTYKNGSRAIDVHLPARGLQIQTGDTRYHWQHGIRNESLLSPRRISITFRETLGYSFAKP